MAQGKSVWTKHSRKQFPKKVRVLGDVIERKRKKEDREAEMLENLLDKAGFPKMETPPINSPKCEICEGMNQMFFTFVGDDLIKVCGKCRKNYEKVFPMFPAKKGIRILKVELGDWEKTNRSSSEYWDYRKEVRELFITVENEEEADYILKKFGDKFQLGILNNKGCWAILTDGEL